MANSNNQQMTALLQRVNAGDEVALAELLAMAYPELRRLAANRLRLEQPGHTLQPTALVNEVYLRLFGSEQLTWQNRAHFFALVAKHMRFILIEHARHKRGRGAVLTVSLDASETGGPIEVAVAAGHDLIELDDVLQKLEKVDARAARGVELRFFVGLTQQEIAEIQQIDVATVKRDWVFARSWLYSRLKPAAKS
jgi:RNA polymerase sigma factor (TIGR02999 family)